MSRVTCLIDARRLKQLREERCLTQQELATRAYGLLGRAAYSTSRAQLTHYQRIEKDGQTSPKMADSLARALGVSVRLLQGLEGPEPEEFYHSIRTLLHRRALVGDNDRLLRELAHHEGDQDERISQLAEDICARIEAAQLSQNPDLLADLVAITGQAADELMAPAHVHGHWCVNIIQYGGHRAEIVHGASSACFQIQKIVEEFLDSSPSDGSLQLTLDGCWYRLVVSDAHRRELRVDAARCIADERGLRWTTPTWRDDLWLRQPLLEWAPHVANFISLFGEPSTPADVYALRLRLTRIEEYQPVAELTLGDLSEIPEHIKEGHRQYGTTYLLAVHALNTQLYDVLSHYIRQVAARRWQVSSTWSGLEFRSTPINIRTMPSVCYRVQLVEQMAPSQFRPVPWRQKDIRSMAERCEAWLANLADWVSDPSQQIPSFTPLPQHDSASQS